MNILKLTEDCYFNADQAVVMRFERGKRPAAYITDQHGTVHPFEGDEVKGLEKALAGMLAAEPE
jgi:hypothetical protein